MEQPPVRHNKQEYAKDRCADHPVPIHPCIAGHGAVHHVAVGNPFVLWIIIQTFLFKGTIITNSQIKVYDNVIKHACKRTSRATLIVAARRACPIIHHLVACATKSTSALNQRKELCYSITAIFRKNHNLCTCTITTSWTQSTKHQKGA